MIEREELWARVQRALDRRRDPLADARVRAGLAQRPEERAELERLLALVGELGVPARRRRRPAAALVGVLLASAAAVAFLVSRGGRAPSDGPVQEHADPKRSRVLSLRMTSERRSADGALIEQRDLAGNAQRSTLQLRPRPADGPRPRTTATLVAWTETETRP